MHGNKPRNHEGTGSTKRGTKGDTHGEKPGKRDETGSTRRGTHMERSLEIMRELDPVKRERERTPKMKTELKPVEGRPAWREAWIS